MHLSPLIYEWLHNWHCLQGKGWSRLGSTAFKRCYASLWLSSLQQSTGQQELISSWKTLPLKEVKPTAEISRITGICETTSPADSGQQQGTLKHLRFQSQDAMASVSQPCRVPLKTSTCPLKWMASPNLLRTLLLWLHQSQYTAKVCTFLTTKKEQSRSVQMKYFVWEPTDDPEKDEEADRQLMLI